MRHLAVATGLVTSVAGPDGRPRELRIARARVEPGRIAGLRAPILDALVLEDVSVREDGRELRRAARWRTGPAGAVARLRGEEPIPELDALARRLSALR